MKANELQINQFLQYPNIQFVIPVYQRNYDWTHTECGQLFKDIISVEKENRDSHFIGSIVFIHEGPITMKEVKELVIIDGQQRLTTLTILYVALYRFAKEQNRDQDAERIFNMFLVNQYVQKEDSKLKLKQTDESAAAFRAILKGTENSLGSYSNVKENYLYFRNAITEDLFETIENGLRRLIFVEISLERDKDDPQRIFESLNSTGLDLSQSDLIRNFILMDLPPKDQIRIYETIWNPIEEHARDKVKQQSMVSEFIRDYLTLVTKKIPNKSKVYQEFKNRYPNKKDDEFYQDLENMKAMSVHYRKLINPQTVSDSDIRRELEFIHRLEINVAYPFLLQVFEDEDNGLLSKAEFVQILKLIQSYVWRRFMVGLPTNALNKIFMTLYSEVDVEEYYQSVARALIRKKGSGKFPTDEEIKTALKDKDVYNTQPKNRSYIFEMLEHYNSKERVDTNHALITVEHIFPQSPAQEWYDELSQQDVFLFREKYLNTIGNLTLSGNNGSLGNKPFLAKKEMNVDGKEQGYIYSKLWLNSWLNTINKWDIEAFERRLIIITDRFLKIWEYPNVVLEYSADTEEQNIFDADIPTFKKLEYFIFEDNRIEESAIAQMYFYVIRKLYEKNSQLLVSQQDIIKISRNASEFRYPQEVINAWYIEANIDSNTKFIILKKLLSLYELEDELIIKYQPDDELTPRENRFQTRKKFWAQLLPKIQNTHLFQIVSPTKDPWLNAGAGISGLAYGFSYTKKHIQIELKIISANKTKNKEYFHNLLQHKEAIENSIGEPVDWEEQPQDKMSRIKITREGISIYDEADWEQVNQFFIEYLPKFENAFGPYIASMK